MIISVRPCFSKGFDPGLLLSTILGIHIINSIDYILDDMTLINSHFVSDENWGCLKVSN